MAADEGWLRWRFLGNLTKALDTNRTKLKWKAAFLTSALAGLIVTVGLVGGYFVYQLTTRGP